MSYLVITAGGGDASRVVTELLARASPDGVEFLWDPDHERVFVGQVDGVPPGHPGLARAAGLDDVALFRQRPQRVAGGLIRRWGEGFQTSEKSAHYCELWESRVDSRPSFQRFMASCGLDVRHFATWDAW